MSFKQILESHSVSYLKKEISKTNVKGYSKMKKNEVINLMLKNPDRFKHIKHKKDTPKPELSNDKYYNELFSDKYNVSNLKKIIKSRDDLRKVYKEIGRLADLSNIKNKKLENKVDQIKDRASDILKKNEKPKKNENYKILFSKKFEINTLKNKLKTNSDIERAIIDLNNVARNSFPIDNKSQERWDKLKNDLENYRKKL